VPALRLPTSTELPLRLRALAILSGRLNASLALSGGVHDPIDAVKAVMAGAHAVQLVSLLLRNGPPALARIVRAFEAWGEEHEYDSVSQMCGSMSLSRCPNPEAFERGNYVRILQSWRRTEQPAAGH
jgi:dihydroorotate dehydrogenase (fumarate)